ncbi:MAG TPA: cyclic nucleotide-binding domain-containing protein, partial [Acidimicrobiales bacterium]|nr:cyclic nucleotide-binding domain-containing protein [Acidimicrobiales bacterium]
VRARLAAGEYFGEIGPLCRMPRSATARARGRAVVTGYGPREFRRMMEEKGPARRQRGPASRARAASTRAKAAAVDGKLP